jgi:hypothetical protein
VCNITAAESTRSMNQILGLLKLTKDTAILFMQMDPESFLLITAFTSVIWLYGGSEIYAAPFNISFVFLITHFLHGLATLFPGSNQELFSGYNGLFWGRILAASRTDYAEDGVEGEKRQENGEKKNEMISGTEPDY